MPQPAYGFCYVFNEYTFTFTLRHGNFPAVRIYTRRANSSSERHATDRRTDTDDRPSFHNGGRVIITTKVLLK